MPEVVDDSIEQGKSNLVPGLAGAAGIGLGTAVFGPGIGMPLGGTLAGAYIGGTEGTILTLTSMAFGFASLIFGNPFAGGMATSTGGSPQGVK